MSTPTTEGREALWAKFTGGEKLAYGCGCRDTRAALLAELEAGVEGLPWDPDRSGRVSRAAVLDLIRKAGKPDAPDVWDDGLPPGGWVCGECGQPVESEPCAEHQPRKASAP